MHGILAALVYVLSPLLSDIDLVEDAKRVTATAYTNSVAETDNTPNITSTGKRVQSGYIAVSKDLLKEIKYGSYVYIPNIPGKNIFKVEDTMHPRKKNTIDIFMKSKKLAMIFGRKKVTLYQLDEKIGKPLFENTWR